MADKEKKNAEEQTLMSLNGFWATTGRRYGLSTMTTYLNYSKDTVELKTQKEWEHITAKVMGFTSDDWRELENKSLKG